MRLVFDNARRFNPAGTDVFVMAGDVEVSTPSFPRCRSIVVQTSPCTPWALMHKAFQNLCIQAINQNLSGLKI